ncbi:MAG: hypothetical protein ACE5QF_04260 [Thermoplasmata archaeon]
MAGEGDSSHGTLAGAGGFLLGSGVTALAGDDMLVGFVLLGIGVALVVLRAALRYKMKIPPTLH